MSAPRLPWSLWEEPAHQARPQGRISAAWQAQIDADVLLRQAVQVVEVIFGDGARFRLASQPVEVPDAPVWVGLRNTQAITNDYDLDDASSAARSLSFEVPTWLVCLPERLALGVPLQGFGEVSLVADGMAWADRRVILRGDMAGGVSFGSAAPWVPEQLRNDGGRRAGGQEVAFGLVDPRASADVPFPPRRYVVEEGVTWDDPHPKAEGAVYPLVWGRAITIGLRVVDLAVKPKWLVAVGHDWDVPRVWVNGEDETGNFNVEYVYDNLGTPVVLVEAQGALGGWDDSDEVQARVLSTINEAPQLLDILRDAIEVYTPAGPLMISDELFSSASTRLGPLAAVGHANEATTILRWLEEGQLADFPMVSMVWDSGLYGPIVTDYRADPVTQLTAGTERLLYRLEDPKETPKENTFNRFDLRYRYNTRLDKFTRVASRNPSNSTLCAAGRIAAGPRPHPLIESIQIREDLAAEAVLDWMEAHLTLPTFFVSYAAAGALFWQLRRGDVVLLTDRDFAWEEVRCTVERITYQQGLVELGLRVWANPFRTGGAQLPA